MKIFFKSAYIFLVIFLSVFMKYSDGYAKITDNHTINRSQKLSNFKLKSPEIYTLNNGLRVMVYVDKRVPVVAHSVWYRVGAADEDTGESGLAHFFEHLMFKGTEAYPDGHFSKYIAQLGGEDNAYTTNDYTVYYQNIASEHLPTVMSMEADRMVNLKVGGEAFYKERDVILEERSMRIDNEPVSLLSEQMSAMLFRNHPYGSPTIGWRHEMQQLTPKSAMAFYKKYYAPNNAIVTVVGDVNPDDVLKIAQKTYGKVPKNHDIVHTPRPIEPPQNVLRTVTLSHENVTLPQMLYYAQGYNGTHQVRKLYALAVGVNALTGSSESYLYHKLVKQDKIALSVSGGVSLETIDYATAMFHATATKTTPLDILQDKFYMALSDAIDKKRIDKQIGYSRQSIIVDFIRNADSRGNIARFLGAGMMRGYKIQDMTEFAKTISSLSDKEIYDALHETFTPENRVIGYLKPK